MISFEEQLPSLKGDRFTHAADIMVRQPEGEWLEAIRVQAFCLDKYKVEEAVSKVLDHPSDCEGAENCDRCWLLKELGI